MKDKNDIIELMKFYALIKEVDGRFYSSCVKNEEITKELTDIRLKLLKSKTFSFNSFTVKINSLVSL